MSEGERYLTLNPILEKHSSLPFITSDNTKWGRQSTADEQHSSTAGDSEVKNTDTADPINTSDKVVFPLPGHIVSTFPLRYKWAIWEQVQFGGGYGDYKDTTRKIASFSTINDFWKLFQSLPQPSELLTAKRMIREEGGNQPVDAIMIFKEGIEPMWEDPKNSVGGHFDYRLNANGLFAAQADEYWNNLVLGMVGSTLSPAEIVTGIRMVDKMERKLLRYELWYTTPDAPKKSSEACSELQKSAAKLLASKLDGTIGRNLECINKSHRQRR